MTTNVVRAEVDGLADKLRDALLASDEPDAGEIVASLRDELAPGEIDAAFTKGLRLLVEQAARKLKREAIRRAEDDARRARARADAGLARADARRQLAEATVEHQALVEQRFFSIWKETPTGRKFLGECTPEDLRYSRDRQRGRSEELLRSSGRDERLAAVLERCGCTTVRELGYERASEAFA